MMTRSFNTKILFSLRLISLALICCYSLKADSTEFSCGNNQQAEQLAQLIKSNNNQQRKNLKCSEKLNEIALIKAHHILKNQNIWHHAGRMTPNQLLRHHGYKLPKTYPIFGNQVEALAGGAENASEVIGDFLESKPHKSLLLGEDDFFKTQDQIGVAYIADIESDHQNYWVVIIATEKNETIYQDPVVEVEPPVINKKYSRGREIKERFYRNKVRRRLK